MQEVARHTGLALEGIAGLALIEVAGTEDAYLADGCCGEGTALDALAGRQTEGTAALSAQGSRRTGEAAGGAGVAEGATGVVAIGTGGYASLLH